MFMSVSLVTWQSLRSARIVLPLVLSRCVSEGEKGTPLSLICLDDIRSSGYGRGSHDGDTLSPAHETHLAAVLCCSVKTLFLADQLFND